MARPAPGGAGGHRGDGEGGGAAEFADAPCAGPALGAIIGGFIVVQIMVLGD